MSDAFFFHIASKNVKLSGTIGVFGFSLSLTKFQKSSAKIKKGNVIVRRKYTVKRRRETPAVCFLFTLFGVVRFVRAVVPVGIDDAFAENIGD